jgi:hypothetical protein
MEEARRRDVLVYLQCGLLGSEGRQQIKACERSFSQKLTRSGMLSKNSKTKCACSSSASDSWAFCSGLGSGMELRW